MDAEEDYCYADHYLENRLRLYYDITQNNLCQEFIKKYNGKLHFVGVVLIYLCFVVRSNDAYFMTISKAMLNECKQKSTHLKELREAMSASDSEQELDSSDVFTLAQKTHELDSTVRSLQTMEDPQMRYFEMIYQR